MPDQLQLRGGTTAEHTSFTGASKEVTIDTTKKTAVVHDASTAGGNPLMREDGANSALINGSVTEPALAFANADADNGIYSPGDDQVAITTAGVERVEWGASEVVFNDDGENYDFRIEGDTEANLFFVDASTDRIGVNTSSPSGLLHIKEDSNNNNATDNANVYIESVNRNANLYLTGSATGSIYFGDQDNALTGRIVYLNTNDSLYFATNASAQDVTIDSDGRLLLGETSTTVNTRFLVRNNATSSGPGNLCIGTATEAPINNATIGSQQFLSSADANTAEIRVRRDGGTWTNGTSHPTRIEFSTTENGTDSPDVRMTIRGGGNVGIGTTDPTVLLDLESTSPTIRLTDSDATGTPECEVSGAGGDLILRADRDNEKTSSLIGFEVDGSERARITSGGYVRLASGTGGIQFNGNTAVANTLDDYEEGTWTPTVSGGASGISVDSSNCIYVKIGSLVHLQYEITGFTGTDNNILSLGGFPFAPAEEGTGAVMLSSVSFPPDTTMITVYYSSSQWRFYASGSGVGWDALTGNEFGSGDVIGSLTYRI